MASFKLNKFSGLLPRVPESLLPEFAATRSENCDFAYGELRNTKGGFLISSMTNVPQSIYTDEGITFYTWDKDVNAVRSPLAKDTFNRLYYTGDGGFKVAVRTNTSLTGGPPGSAYLVGVPRPTQKPTLTVAMPVVNNTTATFVYKFHYEYGGIKYQEQDAYVSTEYDGKQWTFMVPQIAEGATPENAFPVLHVTATSRDDNSTIYDLYTENSSLVSKEGIYSLSIASISGGMYRATVVQLVQESDKETRAYVYTFVNTYGEEGPASDPATVDTAPQINVLVTVTKDAIGSYAPIKEIRLYRTPTGSTIAAYFYVGSVSVLTSSGNFIFNDNVRGSQLNEELSSMDYYPPDQGLIGLMSLPNGILCAWKGNELHFSEAYKPWAWPPKYVKPLANTIVGGIVHGSAAVVTTYGYPYVVSGVSPDAMTASKVNVDQAGVSKWSLAVVDGVVLYASNDGLVAINGNTASLAQGQRFFTRDVWRAKYGNGLSGMRFSTWDGRLIVFNGNGLFTPFMIRVDEADGTLTDLPTFEAKCAFVSQLSDQCYYTYGTKLYQFNGGDDIAAVWQSREMVLSRPTNFGFAQAMVTGTWSLELWAYDKNTNTGVYEYQLKRTQALTSGRTNFRLPSGYESDRYRIKLTGTGTFRELRVANTARELAST